MTSTIQQLPLGRSGFPALRDSNAIYVDKTEMVCKLAENDGKLFFARPRRFGKSLLISTFETLFKNGLRDFKSLAIEKLWKDKTYSVVRLDFSEVKNFRTREEFTERFFGYVAKNLGEVGFQPKEGESLALQISSWLGNRPSRSLVVLIDEYDAPLVFCLDKEELFRDVRMVMSSFFSTLKSRDDCLRFLFMTGITKFSSTSIFSDFNDLTDISLNPEYGALVGYTESEIERYFDFYINEAAKVLGLPREEILSELKANYNGFSFDSEARIRVYCPWSVLSFFNNPNAGFRNYWYSSGGHAVVLMQYLKGHELDDPAKYAEPKKVWLRDLVTPKEYECLDRDVLLYQAGYLTIQSITPNEVALLSYPNLEVASSMAQLYADKLLSGVPYTPRDNVRLETVLAHRTAGDVVDRFNDVINAMDYQRFPIVDEASCRAYLQVLMMGADMVPRVEAHSALGRSDLEVEAGNRLWVFEIKFARNTSQVNDLLQEAVEQMQMKRYGQGPHVKELIQLALVFPASERRFVVWQQVCELPR